MADVNCGHHLAGVCELMERTAEPTMCAHCQSEPTGLFRAKLGAAKALRDLAARLGAGGASFSCYRYGGRQVDAEFCAECRRNAALKQILAGERAETWRLAHPCVHRGAKTAEEEEVKCCGGKTKMVPVYACARREKTHDRKCITCTDYEGPSDRERDRAGCVSWSDLWHCHQGETILVLGCGPSVLLPGEDPDEETVDPRHIRFDRVISTNWAWKWYADICDYQLSFDPTPCLGWRPASVRLLPSSRRREMMEVLQRCHPYCIFPQTQYGNIEQGRPLPCSRNSGFAGLAMAAYMGASRIKVLGMDFCSREGRMHFYPERDREVAVRARSYDRSLERVQPDLSKLLEQIRGMGIEIENLSPISTLEWNP